MLIQGSTSNSWISGYYLPTFAMDQNRMISHICKTNNENILEIHEGKTMPVEERNKTKRVNSVPIKILRALLIASLSIGTEGSCTKNIKQ